MSTILVVGDAGLDVLAKHDGDIVPGGDRPAEISMTLGGAAANTAAWLAWLGGRPVLVGRVGDDPAGAQVRAELTAAGVRCALTVDRWAHTCSVVVLVDGSGQRSMLPDRGAGARIAAADLTPDLLAEADHLHLSGYVLLEPATRDAGIAMLAAARGAGLSTSVDPQSAGLITDPAGFRAAIHGVDLLLPNAEELAALTGNSAPVSARDLLDTVGAVAVTLGDSGAAWIDREAVLTAPAQPVTCVDTTGAGDAFNAALLIARLAGAEPAAALAAGVAAGSQAVGQLGAHPKRGN